LRNPEWLGCFGEFMLGFTGVRIVTAPFKVERRGGREFLTRYFPVIFRALMGEGAARQGREWDASSQWSYRAA
jgi:hypothetical protein